MDNIKKYINEKRLKFNSSNASNNFAWRYGQSRLEIKDGQAMYLDK